VKGPGRGGGGVKIAPPMQGWQRERKTVDGVMGDVGQVLLRNAPLKAGQLKLFYLGGGATFQSERGGEVGPKLQWGGL